jgi:hypothetical protein
VARVVRQTTGGRSGGALLRAHELFRRGPASPEGWSPGTPEYEPRGCPWGASFSWYVYSPIRLRYPYIRGSLIEMLRAERTRLGDPVDAWAAIVVDAPRGALGRNALGGGYDYRATVAVWFRSIVFFHPEPEAMVGAPILYQLHAAAAWLILLVWPFSRLVHAWSIPLQYVGRPYILYRRRGAAAPRRR